MVEMCPSVKCDTLQVTHGRFAVWAQSLCKVFLCMTDQEIKAFLNVPNWIQNWNPAFVCRHGNLEMQITAAQVIKGHKSI